MQKSQIRKAGIIFSLTGNPKVYKLEHRFFIASCLVASVGALMATTINIWLQLSLELILITSFIAVFYATLYFLSLKAGKFEPLVIPYIFVSLLSLSYLWFINAGSNGAILYIITTSMLVYIIITEGFKRIFAITAVFATVSILLFWEFLYPDSITNYPDNLTRFYDLYFTVLISLGITAFIALYISNNYYKERKNASENHQKIIEQNEAIRQAEKDLINHKIHLEDQVKIRTQELERINVQLEYAKSKAEESDKLKTAFLSNMSHEIRTPMNAIIGFSELLKDDDIIEEDHDEFLEIIIEKGNLLLNIINDIIDISKVEANEIKIDESATDINELLDELLASFDHLRKIKGKDKILISLSKQFPTQPLMILADPIRLKQVLSNLIDNAMKFTHEGSIEFGYRINQNENQKNLNFYVKDTGIGIASEMHDIIFNRFRQIDDSHTREFGGTGLGLAISKKLIELMGGSIKIKSEVNKGSIFSFAIPWKEAPVAEVKLSKLQKIVPKFNWADRTFLVVEDNESGYKLIQNYLMSTEATILHAENGAEAVSMVNTLKNIDLVLMDLQLPVMNGYEATRLIKIKRPNLPVIAQSAYAMTDDYKKSKDAGCDDHIPKPLDKQLLLNLIANYLPGKK